MQIKAILSRVLERSRFENRMAADITGPDAGWAWVVCAASCVVNLIVNGQGRMAGILYRAFLVSFGVDRGSASVPFGVRTSTRNLMGPLAGIVGQKYGPQRTILIGGVTSAIGTALCFFASDISSITALWSIIGSMGAAFCMVQIQVVVGQYFKKNKTTAQGIAFSGACVGSFLFPFAVQWMLNNYGIPGVFLVIAGVVLHTVPASMICRKPPWLTPQHLDIQFLKDNEDTMVKLIVANHDEPSKYEDSFILEGLKSLYAGASDRNYVPKKDSNHSMFDGNESKNVFFKKICCTYNVEKSSRYYCNKGFQHESFAKRDFDDNTISIAELRLYILSSIKRVLDNPTMPVCLEEMTNCDPDKVSRGFSSTNEETIRELGNPTILVCLDEMTKCDPDKVSRGFSSTTEEVIRDLDTSYRGFSSATEEAIRDQGKCPRGLSSSIQVSTRDPAKGLGGLLPSTKQMNQDIDHSFRGLSSSTEETIHDIPRKSKGLLSSIKEINGNLDKSIEGFSSCGVEIKCDPDYSLKYFSSSTEEMIKCDADKSLRGISSSTKETKCDPDKNSRGFFSSTDEAIHDPGRDSRGLSSTEEMNGDLDKSIGSFSSYGDEIKCDPDNSLKCFSSSTEEIIKCDADKSLSGISKPTEEIKCDPDKNSRGFSSSTDEIKRELQKLYDKNTTERDQKPLNSFWQHILTTKQLMKNPFFLLICLCRIAHVATFLPMMTTVVDFAVDRGFHEEEGSAVIAVLSAGDMVGRLCFGWVTDKGVLGVNRYMLVTMIAQGANIVVFPLMTNKVSIYVFLFIFGVLQGTILVHHPTLVQKYVKGHAHSIAMGCMDFFPGLIGLGMPFYIGFFRDRLKAYDGMFHASGAFTAMVGLLWAFEPQLQRRCS